MVLEFPISKSNCDEQKEEFQQQDTGWHKKLFNDKEIVKDEEKLKSKYFSIMTSVF